MNMVNGTVAVSILMVQIVRKSIGWSWNRSHHCTVASYSYTYSTGRQSSDVMDSIKQTVNEIVAMFDSGTDQQQQQQ